ncbi:outer membrane protein [Elsinoe ampelina]|uniref:Outer membrane protein n=1 Tax=Elsinoe ampelina TaxID=302913 RepID=A0A6A6GJ70_9PEZI|nr:outer membrane protein [Elsinoe ampelina]
MTSQPGLVIPPPIPPVTIQRQSSSGVLDPLYTNPLVSSLTNVFNAFQAKRDALGLSNPGTVENVSKEVTRDVFLNNSAFSGFRAELQKAFSMAPLFQVCHSFSAGNQQMPPYVFMALYGTNKVFCQGNIESDLSFAARFNYRWSPRWVTKTQTQISPAGGMAGPGAAQFQIENDYIGKDFTAQLKAINPSVLDGALTGIFIGSYMQSVTPRLGLGLEAVYNRMAANMGPESVLSYAARYKGDDWIASGQLLTQGSLSAAYWKRITERVEAGVDMNLVLGAAGGGLMGGPRKEGTATLGAKYDFRASNFKAQIDTSGKVACVLEKRVVPLVGITFSGEIDHSKNSAKLGLAVSIEAADEEVVQLQEKGLIDPVNPPF